MSNFTPQQIEQFLQEFFDTVGARQYVGARYVPVFGRRGESSMNWDNTAPYEPLTIVLYQGNSYTSRQYVPIGVDITDETYWANTGNYNGQVEQYRQEAMSARDDMVELAADLREEMDTLSGDVTQAITDVRDYADSVTDSSRPNVVLLGDSWSDLNSLTIEDNTNWTSFLSNYTFHNFAHSGAGFVVGTTMPQQAQAAAADDTFSHTAVSHCIVMCGINDIAAGHTSSDDYATPIVSTIGTLSAAFPNAQIYILFTSTSNPVIHNGTSNWLATRKLYARLRRYIYLQYGANSTSRNTRVECFVLTHCFPSAAFWPSDHQYYEVHLSTSGHAWLAKVVNHVLVHNTEPTMTGHIDSYTDTDVGVTIYRMTFLYNQKRFRCIGQIETPLISTNSRTVVDLPNSAFTASTPSVGRFLGNADDMFPYGSGYTQPTLLELMQNTLTRFRPWGNASTLASGSRAVMYGQIYLNSPNAGDHKLRLVHYNAETNNIPAMRWTIDMDLYMDALELASTDNFLLGGFGYDLG